MAENRLALVVDDVTTNRVLARAMLVKLGWQVEEAADGETALSMATVRHYGLILLDISMPGLSGPETCAGMRALPGGSELRIVAYTAHAYADERNRILAAGFDEVVVKPINLQALGDVVQKIAP